MNNLVRPSLALKGRVGQGPESCEKLNLSGEGVSIEQFSFFVLGGEEVSIEKSVLSWEGRVNSEHFLVWIPTSSNRNNSRVCAC